MDQKTELRNILQDLLVIKNQPSFILSDETTDPLYQINEYSLLPVRCFTCGKLVSQDTDVITNSILHGYKIEHIMSALGYTRECCRRTIFTSAYVTRFIDYYESLYNEYINMISSS